MSGYNTEEVLNGVSRATNKLILEEPFYGHYFVGLLKDVSQTVQTMAVGPANSQIKLYINPGFWQERLRTDAWRVGLLKHEILHVVLKHIFRAKDYSNKKLFNIACDLVVNQYIREDALPPDRLHLGLFPDLGLKPEMDAHYYYQKLMEPYEKMNQDGGAADGSPSMSISKEVLKRLLEDEGEWSQSHETWDQIDQLPSTLKEVLEDNVTEAVRQALDKAQADKRWSNLPAGLRRSLEEIARKEKAEVNWRRVLRIFAESSRKTYLKNTIRKPSKRFGTTPGIKLRRRQNILVVIDTSGSITKEELSLFAGEIYHIWKRGAEIEVIEVDAALQHKYAFRGSFPNEVKGGGGTDFNPAIRYGNTINGLDAMIYFTDGMAPAPAVVSRFPILWIITPHGIKEHSESFSALPGRKVKIQHV